MTIDKFDTYDFVRTKNQQEDIIFYLLSESERLDYTIGIIKCKNILGVLYRDRAEYAKAIIFHESALALSGTDTMLNVYSLNNLGVVYRRLDKPRIALDYHIKALHLAEEIRGDVEFSERSVCVALNGIGNINLTLKQPQKALEVFNETLLIEQKLHNHLGIAINYQNIGYAFEAMGKYNIALTYYQKSLKQNETIDSDVGRSICYNSIGEVLLKQEKPLDALRNFNLAMVYTLKTNDDYYISQAHSNIGETYLKLNNFEKALPELLKFKKIAGRIKSGFLIQKSYKLLSQYFENTNEYDKALYLYKKAVVYNDSIISEKNIRYLNELQTLYEADKKEQQIDSLTIENRIKTQQNYFYLLGVLIILSVGILIFSIRRRKTDKQKTELESKLFRSLMNPHFIFNALASIQSFLYKNESEKAATYLGYYSKLTRLILKNSNKELITLEEEIETLKYYIEIEQMRQRNCFNYEINIDENVEQDFVYVLPTMLQPFVENAIHHGLSGLKCKNGLIKIEVTQLAGYIKIIIQDNGKGLACSLASDKSTHESMGLSIFKERIRLFERKYKKAVKFVLIDLKEKNQKLTGTMVSIDFPMIEPDD
ncbi:MAG: tetratricopeptide repeat protein [Prolixibacteraceae bacterium]|nr:tetratricopeptide repeat protein [Prolixibacteraceae bacterium]